MANTFDNNGINWSEFEYNTPTYFNNVYEFGQDFNSEQDAIQFANEHDWSKEPISESEYVIYDYCIIDTTKDGKVEICYDYEWQAFFFVSVNKGKNK